MALAVGRRAVLAGVAAAAAGCGGPAATTTTEPRTGTEATMGELTITSPAFEDGAPIPDRYGKDGRNVNPPLRVAGVPADAASLALVVDDPDAPGGTFDHWLAWNIPPGTTEIPEDWTTPPDVVEGTNDFGNVGYDGPRPPEEHTYRFTMHALDTTLGLVQGATSDDLTAAMDGQVLASGTLTGTFAP